VKYFVSDVAKERDRIQLAADVIRDHPQVNVVINNAGIQRQVPLSKDNAEWSERASEIEINFAAPIHLTSLFVPHLLSLNRESAVVNVTSGLAFSPVGSVPVYCATKAALHSYTLSLRLRLQHTTVRVIELIPPAVKSNLGGNHDFGEDCDEFCADVFKKMSAGAVEVGYKTSDKNRRLSRRELDELMVMMHNNMKIPEFTQ